MLLNGNFDQWVSIYKQTKKSFVLFVTSHYKLHDTACCATIGSKYKWLVKGREKGKKNEQNEW